MRYWIDLEVILSPVQHPGTGSKICFVLISLWDSISCHLRTIVTNNETEAVIRGDTLSGGVNMKAKKPKNMDR